MNDHMTIRRKRVQKVSFPASTQAVDNSASHATEAAYERSSQTESERDPIWIKMPKRSPLLHSKSSNTDCHVGMESHVNKTFEFGMADQEKGFLSAFGKKGKGVGEFQDVKSITCLSNDRLLVTDFVNSRLQICSVVSTNVTLFAQDEICMPWDSVVTKHNCIAVTMYKEGCVKVLNADGNIIGKFGDDILKHPTGITIDGNENFIVCDSFTNRVLIFDRQGEFVRFLGNQDIKEECFKSPSYVCVTGSGDVIVSDGKDHKIKVFNSNGDFVNSFGSLGRSDRQFKSPYGVTTDKYGHIYVADHYNSRISMFTSDGVFLRHIVTSEHGLIHPQGLTITPDLRMYVSHGHLKASEILVFQLTTSYDNEYIEFIAHV